MSFYHVVLETNDTDKRKNYIKIIECDHTDLEDIKEEVVIPYLQKSEVYVDGAYVQYSNIRSLKIKQTERTASDTVSLANNNVPSNVLVVLTRDSVMSGNGYTSDITREVIKEVKASLDQPVQVPAVQGGKPTKNEKVFIVHDLAKEEMARFLEKAGLNPIILHEQASSSQTIIEKIESYSDVGYAVVLYTPCDVGGKQSSELELKSRARQNVVFEHGYFIGRLGRSRVSAFLKGDIEAPNDISGVVYIDLDSRGAWKIDLAKELKNAGYTINPSALI